ncbi:MAG: hypothetical protein IJ761_07175 [Bacteroidales bacterium]|nr:hypothetical protein [Bacteroidales bacterium]
MKKTIVMAFVLAASIVSLSAQNTFKGIIKYKVESTGQVDMKIPAEAAVAEIKVSGNDMYTKSAIFAGGMTECILIQNLTSTACINYGQLLSYLRSQGNEFTYEGDGKLLMKEEHKASDFDSVFIVDTEPGHFYYERVAGEERTIAGLKANKLIRHTYDDDGVDHPVEMWYCKEVGPQINVLFGGIPGMPLQCTVDAGQGRAITYTATEVIKGKVKEADFLLPDGYQTLSEQELETLGEELKDAIELMQEE